jgi:hypothetical protein
VAQARNPSYLGDVGRRIVIRVGLQAEVRKSIKKKKKKKKQTQKEEGL